jgi:hypothetical protein
MVRNYTNTYSQYRDRGCSSEPNRLEVGQFTIVPEFLTMTSPERLHDYKESKLRLWLWYS